MNKSQNTFNKGLSMDYHPLNSPNTTLTNCLNGTFISFNGNEYILQNDMGNGRIETAYLPSGYIPVGVTSFGGIIYIASYNPLNKKCLLGCFPSPERNFTENEIESNIYTLINNDMFINNNNDVINSTIKIKLSDVSLYPGDKYLITSSGLNENITDYMNSLDLLTIGSNPKYLKLRIATSNESGQFVYLDSDIKWYKLKNLNDKYYYIYDELNSNNNIVNTREITNSNYSIFNNKISGELYIVAQLELIQTFDFNYYMKEEDNKYNLYFDFYWTSEHESIKPQGAIININKTKTVECLFEEGTSCFITSFDKKEGIYDFEIIPCMDYGKLNQYKINYSIDLSKINTGDISLSLWKYYNSSDYLLLYYGVDAYPEDGWYFHELKLTFNNKLSSSDEEFIITDSNRNSYSGVFSKEILYNVLKQNCIYGVTIEALYKKQNNNNTEWKSDENTKIKTVAKRILYTTTLFNNDFLNSTEIDFKNLYINFDANLLIDDQEFNSLQYKGKWINLPVVTDLTENLNNTLSEYQYSLSGQVNLNPKITTECGFEINNSAIQNLNKEDIDIDIKFDDYTDSYIGDTTKKINNQFVSDYIKPEINNINKSINNFKINITCDVNLKGIVTSSLNKEIPYKGILKPYLYNSSDASKFIMTTTNNGHFLYLNYLCYGSEATMFNVQFDGVGSNLMTYNEIGGISSYAKGDQEGSLPSTSGQFASATIEKIRDNFSNTNVMPFMVSGAPGRYPMDFLRMGNSAGCFTYWNNITGFMTQIDTLYYYHDGINKNDFNGNRVSLWDTAYLRNPAYYCLNKPIKAKTENWHFGNEIETCVPMYMNNPYASNGTVGTCGLLIKSDNGYYIVINGYGHLFADLNSGIGQRLCYNSYGTPITFADAVASYLMQTYYVEENSLEYSNVPKDFSYYDQVKTVINILINSKYNITTSDITFNGNTLLSLNEFYKDYDFGNNFNINETIKGDAYNAFNLYRTLDSEPIIDLYSNPNKLDIVKIKTNTYGGLYSYDVKTDEYIGRVHTYAFNRNENKLYRISYNDLLKTKDAVPFTYLNNNYSLVTYTELISDSNTPLYNDLNWGTLGISDDVFFIQRNGVDLMPSAAIKCIRNDYEKNMPMLVTSLTDTAAALLWDINGLEGGENGNDHQFWLQNINYDLSLCKYLRCYIHNWQK